MSRPLYAIVLAAGESSRLGTAKQLLELGGKTLLVGVVQKVADAGADHVVVVTGHGADQIAAVLMTFRTELVYNSEWKEGMGGTIAIGVRHAASSDAEAVLIALTDQPWIGADHYRDLIRRYRTSGRAAATGYPDGTCGVPAVFPEEFFAELASLSGDQGARQILARNRDLIEVVPNPDAAFDVDVPEDLRR